MTEDTKEFVRSALTSRAMIPRELVDLMEGAIPGHPRKWYESRIYGELRRGRAKGDYIGRRTPGEPIRWMLAEPHVPQETEEPRTKEEHIIQIMADGQARTTRDVALILQGSWPESLTHLLHYVMRVLTSREKYGLVSKRESYDYEEGRKITVWQVLGDGRHAPDYLKLLSCVYFAQLMHAIAENPDKTLTYYATYEGIKTPATARNTIAELKAQGVVSLRMGTDGRGYYSLTNKGQRVVSALDMLREAVNGV